MRSLWLLLLAFVVVSGLPLEVSLRSQVTRVDPSTGTYDIDFAITNTHTSPLVLLKWNTPLENYLDPFPSNMFQIKSLESGPSPVYMGIAQKRFPLPEDFVTIQPNETIEVQLNLLKGYWFPEIGKYEVTLISSILVHEGVVTGVSLDGFEFVTLVSSPLSVLITKAVPKPALFQSTMPSVQNNLGGITDFTNCTTALTDASKTADANADTLLRNVNNYLSGRTCDSSGNTRYVTWFGTCTATRLNEIKNHFIAISNRRSNGYKLYCSGPSCRAGVFAYVYPDDASFTVYVCSAYITGPVNCAYDSKPGTIIHELSHFTAVAGTQDYTYGTSSCQQLAKDNPNQAINNADSHEYMSECSCNGC